MSKRYLDQIFKASTDEWYTYPQDVIKIIPFLQQMNYYRILCPFDTKLSAFYTVLSENGFRVTQSHIEEGIDFFSLSIEYLQSFDAVVSNPPFSKSVEILKRLYQAQVPFALIQNFNGLFDSRERMKLFRQNQFEIFVPCKRMKFYNAGNSTAPFKSVFLCSKILPQKIILEKAPEEG